jgi:hypothetical protein
MNTKYARVYGSCDWQKIEEVCELLPHYRAPILPLALSKEPIHLSGLSRLMIAPEQCEPVGVS